MKSSVSLLLKAFLVLIITAARLFAAEGPHPTAEPSQSKVFVVLASGYVAVNALDFYTTTRAISTGAGAQANPVMAPLAGNAVGLGALKAASTTATIVLARQLWKKHPAGAIALLVGANLGMSFVVAHNASLISR